MENFFTGEIISPFRIFADEVVVPERREHSPNQYRLNNAIQRGVIADKHINLLGIVNEYRFVTSKQVCDVISTFNLYSLINYIPTKDDTPELLRKIVDRILDTLFRWGLLRRFHFSRGVEYKRSYNVYALDTLGVRLLGAKDVKITSRASDISAPVYTVKKALMRNQIYLAIHEQVESYKFKPRFKIPKILEGIISPSMSATFKDFSCMFEVVRRNTKKVGDYTSVDWKEDLKAKLRRYRLVYESFNFKYVKMHSSPVICFIVEDDIHANEVRILVDEVMSTPLIKKSGLFGYFGKIFIKPKNTMSFKYYKDIQFKNKFNLEKE